MRLLLLAAAAVCVAAPALAAPSRPAGSRPAASPHAPAVGLWRLEDDNVHVRIVPCGQSLCGRVASADKLKENPRLKDKMNKDPSLRNRPVRNLLVLWGFTGGPRKWTGGRVYNPDDGRTYKSELTMADANTLKVTGCIFKPLCKSETLTRVR